MAGLYDVEINLSSSDGGLPRDSIKHYMIVRLYGHTVERHLSVPQCVGSIVFKNEGEEVSIRRGGALPINLPRNCAVHVLFDGTPNGMCVVGV
jgi:hypothetical protein